MKRLNAPKKWNLGKMAGVFAPRPSQGPHKLRECIPVNVILRDKLKYALTNKECMQICMERCVKVDGKVSGDVPQLRVPLLTTRHVVEHTVHYFVRNETFACNGVEFTDELTVVYEPRTIGSGCLAVVIVLYQLELES